MQLPTVCIVNANAKSGFTRINESDFDPAIHALFDEAAGKPVEAPLKVGKGPQGKFFVKRGKDMVSAGFDTEAEAEAEMANMAAGA